MRWADADVQARDWLTRVLPDALVITNRKTSVRWGPISGRSIEVIDEERWARMGRVDKYSASAPYPVRASGALVDGDLIFSQSTRSVASLEQPLGTRGRWRQRSCFSVGDRLLAPRHRSADGARLRFGQVLNWVVAVDAPDGEDAIITSSAIRGTLPLRARVKLFEHVGENDIVRHIKGQSGASRLWVPPMLVNLNKCAIVLLPVDLVELDACIVVHPQKMVASAGFCVVTAVRYNT